MTGKMETFSLEGQCLQDHAIKFARWQHPAMWRGWDLLRLAPPLSLDVTAFFISCNAINLRIGMIHPDLCSICVENVGHVKPDTCITHGLLLTADIGCVHVAVIMHICSVHFDPLQLVNGWFTGSWLTFFVGLHSFVVFYPFGLVFNCCSETVGLH